MVKGATRAAASFRMGTMMDTLGVMDMFSPPLITVAHFQSPPSFVNWLSVNLSFSRKVHDCLDRYLSSSCSGEACYFLPGVESLSHCPAVGGADKRWRRGRFISVTLHQDIEHVTVLIHRTPQIITDTVDRKKDLIETPLVPRSGAPTAQPVSASLSKLPAPLADRFVRHEHSAHKQQFLDVSIAAAEPVI